MTVKDILRETAGGSGSSNEVALDDKKSEVKPGFRGLSIKLQKRLTALFGATAKKPRIVVGLLALITVVACIVSIVAITLHALIVSQPKVKTSVVASAKSVAGPTLSPLQKSLASLMPAKIGGWTRCESQSDIWNDQNVGNSTVQTYVSTYKLGSARAYLWAVRAPLVQNQSPLIAFEGMARAVHTDNGVDTVLPQVSDIEGKTYVTFDYTPGHSEAEPLIVSNQTFAPQLPHTISWYAAPFVVTVAAANKDVRDSFAAAMSQ